MNERLFKGDGVSCPLEMANAVRNALFETLQKCLGHVPCGDDLLSALAKRPAHWLVPLMLELSWTGMDTSHCVVDAEGNLTGKRVWLEEDYGDEGLLPDPEYTEVLISICSDGSVVMTLDGSQPATAWQGFFFAMHHRDLATLLDDEGERQKAIVILDELAASRLGEPETDQ